MTNKKNTDKKHKQVKVFAKNLNDLFSLCSQNIVEYYEPKLLPAYYLRTKQIDMAEMQSEKLLQSNKLINLSFDGSKKKGVRFLLNQIYINVLMAKYGNILKDSNGFDSEIKFKLLNRLDTLDAISKDSNSIIDKATHFFLKGAYYLGFNNFALAEVEFSKSVQVLDTISQKSDTIKLTLARVLNNYAYCQYHTTKIDEAWNNIIKAIDFVGEVRKSNSDLSSINQVYGLCLSTQCEVLWLKEKEKEILKICALLIEIKKYDKTFKFNQVFDSDPIYKKIVRSAKKIQGWETFMLNQIDDNEERKAFLEIK